ncbi:MAG: CPBP family intramembrane metalloprotease [Elusimicrobia bacterium]|nr:CPBP family intramembrane metalloprotease [Elusimicrobiota bacterium]
MDRLNKGSQNYFGRLLAAACFMPFAASVVYFFVLDGSFLAKWVYLAAKIIILLLPVYVLGISKIKEFPKALKPDRQDILLGLLSALFIFILFYLLLHTPLWRFIEEGKTAVISKVNNFNIGRHFLLYSLIISFVHSMVEEYYWRWFVFGGLKKFFRGGAAHIMAALAFSLHHFVVCVYYFPLITAVILTFAVFCGGMLFSTLYNRKGLLPGAWIAHAAADICIFYAGVLLLK